MAPDNYAALEAKEKMLAHRVYRLEPPAVHPQGDTRHLAARIRALGLDPIANEHLQATGRTMEGIALGHAPSVPESGSSAGATKRNDVRARVRHPGAPERVGGGHDLIAQERTAEEMPLADVAAGGTKA